MARTTSSESLRQSLREPASHWNRCEQRKTHSGVLRSSGHLTSGAMDPGDGGASYEGGPKGGSDGAGSISLFILSLFFSSLFLDSKANYLNIYSKRGLYCKGGRGLQIRLALFGLLPIRFT